jgi:hypothetical protein
MRNREKPGPKPEVFKVDQQFEDAVKIALNTKPPEPKPPARKKKRPKKSAG